MLKLHQLIHLSSNFELVVEDNQSRFLCRVVWRQGDLLGVLFKSEGSSDLTDDLGSVDEKAISRKSSSS